MKRIFTFLILAFLTSFSYGQALLTEPFDYTPDAALGLAVQSGGTWTRINTGDSILVESGSLSYTGLAASAGNKVTYGGAGADYYRAFANQTTGTVYFSFLLNVGTIAPMTTGGDYFVSLIQNGSATSYYGRLNMRLSGTGYNVGINAGSTAANLVWASTVMTAGQTYLVVGSYQIVDGTTNDVAKIWVNPVSLGGTEPTADATSTNTGTDASGGIERVILRQGSGTYAGVLSLDELRIGTSWATVTPVAAVGPTLSASGAVSGLNATIGTASPSGSFNLTGSSLTGAPGNITVTTSSNDFEVSTDDASWDFSTTIPYSAATLTSTPVYVRISADAATLGPISGTVTLSGGGATAINVSVSGIVTVAAPSTQASNIIISNILDAGFDVNWTNGNGEARIVVVRQTSTAAVAPADGTVYTVPANTGAGNAVVYSGTGTGPITVTGLNSGTSYTIQVYEYNGVSGSNNYNTATATNNPVAATTTGITSSMQQGYFTSVSTALYAGRSTFKIPYVYIATVSGLAPNTTYRYYGQAAAATDFGTTNSGAGTLILNDYTLPTPAFYTASLGGLNTVGQYGKFTTNANGAFTGTFGFFTSSNTRFNTGAEIFPALTIGDDIASSTVKYRFALNQSMTVLDFAETAGPNTGSFIKGTSNALPNNVVALWKSEDGSSLVAARPIAMTLVENNGATTTGLDPLYDESAGSWNTIIPNDLPTGVRLIQQFNLDGTVVGCNSDADGTWGTTLTVNPSNGLTTALQINAVDAPLNSGTCFAILPISMSNFAVQKAGSVTRVTWTTQQELNSKEFVIERSTNSLNWDAIGFVAAAGSSSQRLNYSFIDNSPAKGINFYRIRSVDVDNKFSNSAIKSVLFSNADVVLITPNPASSFVNIYMSKNNNSLSQIIVADANGKVVANIRTADQTHQLQTSNYAKGLYVIKVIGTENTITQKVIIQ